MATTDSRILDYLETHGSATAKQLGDYLGITPAAIFRQLKKLGEQGKIKKRGTPPSVTYHLETRVVRADWGFKLYAGRSWYHQRFDGSPQFIAMIGEAETRRESRKPAETEARWRICFFADGKADWYLDQEDIDRGAAAIVRLAEKSEHAGRNLMAAWKKDEAAFANYYTAFAAIDLVALTDEALIDEYERFHELSIRRFTSSSLIDHFALGTDQLLAEKLREELNGLTTEKEFNTLFSIATAPVHRSFINEAEISLLRIACRVQQGALLSSSEIQEELRRHQSEYFWTANNYVRARILSIEHFEKEIESWLESGRDLAELISQIEGTPERNRKAKKRMLAEAHFTPLLRSLIQISEDFTEWQDERKKATYLCIHMGNALLGEMSRRRGIDVELSKYLLPTEVESWFLGKAITPQTLADRQRGCAVIWEEGIEQAFLSTERQKIMDIVLNADADETVSDIRGLVACTGRAIGTVRILLSADEINKVKDGDILVAVMTRPDYVPAMRRAGAIVTNEGGITCHAAIVSRELGVPCIIGTKVATRVFKDGDLVEVNANHNWIRKVTR